ncbi:unnamed protein product [Parnassius apollo]|uniref:(apollo) hypothetical protein n=1 Tax=Parnassius apollo TaxID=110799 RepID=A0A8S3XZM3_PARAO|nr:unnamed protein product [Parnassius apollo]
MAPLEENYSIDEAMVPYYGRHSCKQFIRGKPIRWGYKLWVGATRLGYLIWFDPYQRKSSTIAEGYKQFGLGGSVHGTLVWEWDLAELCDLQGRDPTLPFHLFFDNYFSSIPLLHELSNRGLRATGTIRENRTSKCPLESNKDFKNTDRGSFVFKSSLTTNILEESRPSLSDQPTTLPADEQRTTTASNEQPSTSAHEDDQTQVFQSLSSAATISQQAIPSTPKIKKSACLFCDHVKKKLEHPEPRYWHKNRQFHHLAFNAISEIIKTEIIGNNRVVYLTDLFTQYKSLLLEFAEGQVRAEDIQDYRVENLENKIIKAFGDRVTIESSMGTPKKKIVYQYDMDTSRLAGEIAKLESTKKNRFRDVAYELCNCITSLESTKLPDNLTPKDVILGECNIPEQLFNFVCDLVQGPDTRRKNSAEEIETEMTYSSQNENNAIPAGISRVDGLSTHVAFDNFDRFVDTATGKDTLNDTVGIIYQFRSENDDPDNMDNSDTSDSESLSAYVHEGPTEPLARARKRRRFEAPSKEIRPFVKTPFTSMTFLPFQTITETIDACHSDKSIAIDKDLVWSMSLSQIDSVPMWLGYNCKIGIDESKIQTVEYLSRINESPTSLAVVQETLNIAKEIAKNCNQQQIIATYDLAIAKLAMQIQHTKKPEFDDIFINLGAFHTQMAFFKAIGKYIDSSGLVEILVEAELSNF